MTQRARRAAIPAVFPLSLQEGSVESNRERLAASQLYVRAGAGEIGARAEALMLEQTVELPRTALRDPAATDRVVGLVESVEPASPGRYRVTISQPLGTTAHAPAQLLNVTFGNSSLQPDVALADLELPEAAFDWLPGPGVGISGLRALTGVSERPILATALKPMGLRPEQLGALCRGFAAAGIDLIKVRGGGTAAPAVPTLDQESFGRGSAFACQRRICVQISVQTQRNRATPGSVPTLVEKAKWRYFPAGQSKSPRSTAKEARHAGE